MPTMEPVRSFFLFAAFVALGAGLPVDPVRAGGPLPFPSTDVLLKPFASFEPDPIGPELVLLSGENPATCELVGGFDVAFPFPNRFVGNVYRVNTLGRLRRFSMELIFQQPAVTNLYFTLMVRQPGEENFRRIMELPMDKVVAVNGVGRQFFGSGEISPDTDGIALAPGPQYLLGVSWGNVTISAPRDLDGVRPFSHGTVSGFGVLSLENGPPVDPDNESIFLGISSSGAYSMELCFEPEVGACCCGSGRECELLFATECTARGGFFQGERITCDDANCLCGACCTPCGDCRNDYTPTACLTELDGLFQGSMTQCVDEDVACEVVTGACCSGTTCRELCEENCLAIGGVFRGDGTDCNPNICVGACCREQLPFSTSSCGVRTPSVCAGIGGIYLGDGTTCATAECGGACCDGDPERIFCNELTTRAFCTDENLDNPHYLGDGTICPDDCTDDPDLPVFGACCIANGVCLKTGEAFCGEGNSQSWIQGEFFSGMECSQIDCLALPTGACCFQDGSCQGGLTKPTCVSLAGVYQGDGSSCAQVSCTAPTGACCHNDDTCTVTTAANCAGLGDVYKGDRSTCAMCGLGEGACCFDDGTPCQQLPEVLCPAKGATWSRGISCDICPPPIRGACCLPDGTCEAGLTEAQCRDAGGAAWEEGQPCEFITCVGACCQLEFRNVVCTDEEPFADCDQAGGAWMGPGSFCGENACLAEGACCDEEGFCAFVAAEICITDPLALWQGPEVLCDPNPCVQPVTGACCLPSGACADGAIEDQCVGSGGTYLGDDTTCGPDSCTGACCIADPARGCELLTAADCLAAPGEFMGIGTSCDPDPCMWACCTPIETCNLAMPLVCTVALNGAPQVGVTNCDPNPCVPRGACCLSDGSCTEQQSDDECTAADGSYQGDDTTCDQVSCPQPTGACCVFQAGCQVHTQQECILMEGTYRGDGTTCDPDECPWACCDAQGICTEDITRAECDALVGATVFVFDCLADLCTQSPVACCIPEGASQNFPQGGCVELTISQCIGEGGEPDAFGTSCSPFDPCDWVCCVPGQECAVTVTEQCEQAVGGVTIFSFSCDPNPCPPEACCLPSGECRLLTQDECLAAMGTIPGSARCVDEQGNELVICDTPPRIISSDPPCGAIDARQPHIPVPETENPEQLPPPQGWDAIVVIFEGTLSKLPTEGDFSLRFVPDDLGPARPITDVIQDAMNPQVFLVVLSGVIPVGHWTILTHVPSGTSTCLGYLPGDVTSDGTSSTVDIIAFVDFLNDVGGARPIWSTDMDRSALPNSADIIRLVDLLNGAGAFDVWNNVSLPPLPQECCQGSPAP